MPYEAFQNCAIILYISTDIAHSFLLIYGAKLITVLGHFFVRFGWI